VRQGADDLHRLGGRQQAVTAQHRPQQIDALGRPARQVGERAVLGFAVLAVALAQQDRRWRAPIGYDRNIHAQTESDRFAPGQAKSASYMTAIPT